MPFNSLDFAGFFALTFGLYALAPGRFQNLVLLLASLYAYSCWKGSYLGLVLLSGVLDYWLGWRIFANRQRLSGRLWLCLSLLYNLSILAYFKYGLMIAEALVRLGLPAGVFPGFLEMPVGISFFTFQSMGYAIDVYRGRTTPATRMLDYMLFVSFFAQMMSGPIERARGLLRQLERPRRLTPDGIYIGLARVLWGLFQKLVIADNLGLPVRAAFARYAELSSLGLVWVMVMFALELYADFSGYTDMALGMAQMLGLRLTENFRAPYLAKNATDFWMRWNITLMAWFRDYVYFPLAGRSSWRAALAALVVFTLSGLWHGPAWHFALWGLFNGFLILAVRLYAYASGPRLPAPLAGLATLLALLAFLLLFRATSVHQALDMAVLFVLGDGTRGWSWSGLPWEALVGAACLLAVDLSKEPRPFSAWFGGLSPRAQVLAVVGMIMGSLLLGAKAGVNFVYLQF